MVTATLTQDSVEYWESILGISLPLYSTKPTPGAPNELAKVERLAEQLGTPLLPWQRYFVRVATELNPDGSYRYPTVILTVPRQSGKTTVVRALLAARSLMKPKHQSFLTAQTGKDARARLGELADQLLSSIIGKTIAVRRAVDSPHIKFHNGAKINSFAPTEQSLHGYNFSVGFIDEFWKFDEEQGHKVIGAMLPAMQTHHDRQLIMVSTKGTATSTFLNKILAQGRLAVSDPNSATAYFEWGLEEGKDVYDPKNWDFHPGLHGKLITKADISAAAVSPQMSKGEFTRGYMNRYTDTVDSVFDLNQWDALRGDLETPKQSQVAIAYEVSHDRSKAAIVAAWKIDGQVYIKVIRNDKGTDWLKPTLVELSKANPLMIGADKYQANNVIADSTLNDYPAFKFKQLTSGDFATACGSFKARVEEGTIIHDGHFALRQAVTRALTRPFGDAGWVFSHRGDPELIAAVTAVRLVDEVKVEEKPMIYFAD
jgi:phage terminase large subunit-like protein